MRSDKTVTAVTNISLQLVIAFKMNFSIRDMGSPIDVTPNSHILPTHCMTHFSHQLTTMRSDKLVTY